MHTQLQLHSPSSCSTSAAPGAHLEGLVHLQQSPRQLEDVVADRALLGGVLDADGALGHALDQDVAHLVHLQLEALFVRKKKETKKGDLVRKFLVCTIYRYICRILIFK